MREQRAEISVGADIIRPLRDALSYRASLFQKQSTGLFLKFTLAERFVTAGLCPTPTRAVSP